MKTSSGEQRIKKISAQERPTDPEQAELYDPAMIIQDKNANRSEIERAVWVCYGIGIVTLFIPPISHASLPILFIGIVLLITSLVYDIRTNKLRLELYDKANRRARKIALQLIDQAKSAFPDKDASIAYDGTIVLADKKADQ